jgi:hypothetical protein
MRTHSVILTLVLLGTIAAAHTDHPVFSLLVGPAPLGVGFTVITFLRQGFGRQIASKKEGGNRTGPGDQGNDAL